jgi:hypothetical protein
MLVILCVSYNLFGLRRFNQSVFRIHINITNSEFVMKGPLFLNRQLAACVLCS